MASRVPAGRRWALRGLLVVLLRREGARGYRLVAADLERQHLEFVRRTRLEELLRNRQTGGRGRHVHAQHGFGESWRRRAHWLRDDDLVADDLDRGTRYRL